MNFSQIHIKIFVILLAILPLSFQACEQDKSSRITEDPVFRKLDEYLNWEEQNGFSGIVSVKAKDKSLYTRSFGYSNKEKQIPVSSNTVFDIGSLTKQFTAAGILKLEMNGKLKVEDTLGKFFPNIPEDKQIISLHQLLTHTSGLRRSLGYDYLRTNKSDFLQALFASELRNDPGSTYNYSHAGYSLLGAVIEKVSGLTYEEYLSEELFQPAGMKHTGYVIPLWEESEIAHGYKKCRDWGKPMDMPWSSDGPYWNLKANAGLISSSEDLMLWIEALSGNEILSESAKEKLVSPHVREVREGRKSDSHYGYGWVIGKSERNTNVYFHNGGNGRFYSDVIRYETEDVTILLLSNLDKPGNDNISWELAKIILWPDYEPEVQGVVQECFDSLPDNRIGEIAGKFLALINEEKVLDNQQDYEDLFADHLKNRREPEHIIRYLNDIKQKFRPMTINNIVVTNHQVMDIYLSYFEDGNKKNLSVSLVFDEEDNYLIRWLSYDRRSR